MKTSTCALSSASQPTASLIFPLKASILRQIGGIQTSTETEASDELPSVNPSVLDAKMAIKHDLQDRCVVHSN